MEILRTKRLRLRNFLPTEGEQLLRLYEEEDVKRSMHWKATAKDEIDYILATSTDRTPLDQGAYHYAISFLKSDRLIGEIYLEKKEDRFVLGYLVKKERQGHGYAFEILTALLKKLDEDYPFLNVEAVVDRENEKSRRLLRKLGFHNDLFQDERKPYLVYSLYGSIR